AERTGQSATRAKERVVSWINCGRNAVRRDKSGRQDRAKSLLQDYNQSATRGKEYSGLRLSGAWQGIREMPRACPSTLYTSGQPASRRGNCTPRAGSTEPLSTKSASSVKRLTGSHCSRP